MRRIEGKIAVVTGGAQGLGEAAVQRLTDEGAQVILSKYITGAEMVVDGGMTVGLPY